MYFARFSSLEDVAREFDIPINDLAGLAILFASYDGGGYDGDAHVIFEDSTGKLYEVQGSHCSCYGLEKQWNPEETSWEAIGIRPLDYGYGKESSAFLKKLVTERRGQ